LSALTGDLDTWRNVLARVLPTYTRTTLILVVIVGVATAVIGSVTA
jgi:iron(III) transport system permease protein